MWPNLGHVEDVPRVVLGLFRSHDLNKHIPLRIVTLLDRFEEVLNKVVWVLAGDFRCGLAIEVSDSELAFDVHLDVSERTVLTQPTLALVQMVRGINATSFVNLYVWPL